jgi:anaerobic magnesium-protoporphyrin IX monomethyl ester cyclase
MAKLQLINLVTNQSDLLEDRWPLPLNLVWIGTYLKQFGYDVEILDTNILDLHEVIKKIDAQLIGICFYATSAHLLDDVVSSAKEKGSIVVVGGQAATSLVKQLLRKNTSIDAVIFGDGEKAMLDIIRKVERGTLFFNGIPNVAYRNGDDIVFGPNEQIDITSLPLPDRRIKGLDIESYISNFSETNTDLYTKDIRATNAYMKKGCPRRTRNKGCSFCARVDIGLREKTALQTYEEYNYLIREFGINYIFDDSDSWVKRSWMKNLRELYNKNGELSTKLRVYADVRDINEENVRIMKDLGVDAVLIGIESGDEHILRFNGKLISEEMIIKAVKLLGTSDIKLCDAYVLGLLGESKKSVERTISLARQISNYCEKQITYWNMIMPLPGSRIWNNMMMPLLQEKYGSNYNFDMEDVRKDYIHYFCNLGEEGYNYLMNICKYLQSIQNIPLREYIR